MCLAASAAGGTADETSRRYLAGGGMTVWGAHIMRTSGKPGSIFARLASCVPPSARGPGLLTALLAALLASGSLLASAGLAGAQTRAAAAAGAGLARCTSGTCYVAVSVATLWVKPSDPRKKVDQPALTKPADPRAWIDSMSLKQKSWLVGRIETQALYGTEVKVIGHDGGDWTQVAVPSQPTNRDALGYPGWVPTIQLTSTAPPAASTTAVVRAQTAWLWSNWNSAGVSGTKVTDPGEISYDTRLPVAQATPKYVVVSLIDGTHVAVKPKDVALHAEGASWDATPEKLVTEAKKFLGLQYLWGGTSGFGYDCSGFTYSVYHAYGVTISRDAGQQYAHGTPVSAPLSADLVFFGNVTEGSIGHVGMYVGDGNMIDAPQTGAAVQIEPLYTDSSYYAGARRYLP